MGEWEAARQARCWSAAAASAPSGYLMEGLMCLNAVIVPHIPASCSPIKINKVYARDREYYKLVSHYN